ncbi:alpha-keto acid decarboxylase family protein [Paenibacillus spongiae]|uniref:Alpha-keto-acid decarboxylase n=1 Tax=Paenibacillus spongiae TaxID=2909671 RepID=A0ABY5SHX6_9BACL|nr:thiamine pyrophosphate-binding protein [Paenibacillus spongiae]UVI33611.1 thiamine pyrophosphate-dependent enzyme [Paenibacillus spongiae]
MDDKQPPMPESSPTLGQYLFDCLKAEGITEIFGIPGDYNFSLLDTLERYDGIRFINGRNELGAGYASDGYGRLRGLSALITTFGVGEMSACNAIAGASSEHVPIVHIVGAPKSMDQQAHKLVHHTLLNGDFDVFRQMYGHLCAYAVILTPENAEQEIPAAIRIAKQTRKPVYLMVAIDLVAKPIVRRAVPEKKQGATSKPALEAAVQHISGLLNGTSNVVLLSDVLTLRFGLRDAVQQLALRFNMPAASLMLGKSSFDERHPNYIGVYGGAFGSDQVRNIVESAECVIAVGMIWTDINSAKDTAKLDRLRLVDIQPEFVRVGEAKYEQVMAADLIAALIGTGWTRSGAVPPVTFPYDMISGEPDEPIRAASYYPRFQRMLKDKDIVVVETGTFAYGMSQVRLPAGADYIGQQGWQSIGYATPAAFGACMAAPDRRVLLFTGDGSLQLTVQEISTMLTGGCRPILFILNNSGYTIEKYLNVKTSNQPYNQIPAWHYTQLAEVFGGQAFTAQARTNRELDEAIAAAEQAQTSRLCIIELIVTDPLDAPDYLIRLRKHLERQERLKG